ncbi:hypothetical protein [Yinghuangia seranimata]|uniref:hypothetical protein n=1 Tax=Yinghuangia seranimata TaxID=408067 RepID=UPI00248BE457|nr:hypothetical protein [Yinghuangia seranimata]MDI2127815.1 hypothetical protein [Yinghuangia seranimata]
MSWDPFVHVLVAAAAERMGDDAAPVLRRVVDALPPGSMASLAGKPVALPDAFVALAAEQGGQELLVALAGNPCLTPHQLTLLLEAGGDAVRVKAFDPARGRDVPADAIPVGFALASATAVPPVDQDQRWSSPLGFAADSAVEDAWAAIRSRACRADEAVKLLGQHPVLAYTARVRTDGHDGGTRQSLDLRPLLHHLDDPHQASSGLAEPASGALAVGAVTPRELVDRIRPALVATQLVARLTREHAPGLPAEADADALLRPLLAATVGADPRRWAALATRLPRETGPLPALLAAAAAEPADDPAIVAPNARSRPALLFLLRRMDAASLGVLLPHLEDVRADLIPGDVPIRSALLELAHASGNRALLRAVARHQHLRDAEAHRLRAYDDLELDRILAFNRAGTTASLRREVFAGVVPGGPRREPDPVLRQKAIDDPQAVESSTLAYSGDPVLVCLGLPGCHHRLRRVDQLDVVLALWERSGMDAVDQVLTSVPQAISPAVRKLVARATAAGDAEPLRTERDKLAQRAKAKPAPRAASDEDDAWRMTPAERIRAFPLGLGPVRATASWTRAADPADLVRVARPAEEALRALAWRGSDGASDEVHTLLDTEVATPLGTDPEAWAVLVALLPEFEGTLPELAALCAAATYRETPTP